MKKKKKKAKTFRKSEEKFVPKINFFSKLNYEQESDFELKFNPDANAIKLSFLSGFL